MFNRFFGLDNSSLNNNNKKPNGGSSSLGPPHHSSRNSRGGVGSSSTDQTTTTTIIPKNIKPLPNNHHHSIPHNDDTATTTTIMNNNDKSSTGTDTNVEKRLIFIKNLNQIPLNGRFVYNDEESRRLFAIFRTKKNRIYAIDEYCYHMGGPLEKGDIEDLIVNYKDKSRKHSCVICPWHHYYISLKTGESFYLDIDRTYKSKGQRQRTYPLYYDSESMDLYLELDSRLELNYSPINCTGGCETSEKMDPIKPLDSDHYVKIHQQKYSNTESSNTKPHSVVNLKELKEKREMKKNDKEDTVTVDNSTN